MDAIVGQTLGGTLFSLLAGQPLIVIMTTAPIALYIKIIVAVAEVHKHFAGNVLFVVHIVQIMHLTGARHGLLRTVYECRSLECCLRDTVCNNQRNQADEVFHPLHRGDLCPLHLHCLHCGRRQGRCEGLSEELSYDGLSAV